MIEIQIKQKTLDEQDNAGPKSTPLTKEESEILDFCMELGQTCWEAFCATARAKIMLLLLPSDFVRTKAMRLFQLGFCSRMLACPPRGPEVLDSVLGPIQCDKTWQDFLKTANGKVYRPSGSDLDGEAYPATSQSIVQVARFFFRQGFMAGNVAARECMKES